MTYIYFELQDLVNQLYDVFLGTLFIKGKDGKLATTSATGVVHIKPENKRSPSNTRLRLKLLPYLVRSKEASLCFPASIQVIFDLLFGTGGNTNAKLKTLAVQFIHAVVENCPENRITSCGGVLLSALNKLVMNKSTTSTSNPDGEEQPMTNAEINAAAKLRASCYVAIGKLGLKMPQLVNKGQAHDMFSRIFRIRIYELFSTKYYVIFFLIFSNGQMKKKIT